MLARRTEPRRAQVLALLLPAIAAFLAWLPWLSASFQFDDWNVIVDEPRVHSLAAWWASMPGIRPLLKLSYALNYALSPAPFGFRLFNVCIHALSGVLAYWLLRVRGLRAGLTVPAATIAAMLAALLFVLHPVQTESVTYISGRSSSLAGFFSLLSLGCWVRSELGFRVPWRAHMWLAACCLAFACAVASKETALVLPLVLWLYSAEQPTRATLRRLAPVILVACLLLISVASLPRYQHLLVVSMSTRSIGENLLMQSQAVLYLAAQLVRLWNGNADPQLASSALSGVLCAMWTAILVAALVYIRRAPVGAFAVLWFLSWLAPTNSLVPRLDLANDRQLYLALLGPAWWLAVTLTRFGPKVLFAGAVSLLAVVSVATAQRNSIYRTEVSFWEDTAARNPKNARAANNLGMAYAMTCRLDEAQTWFARAIDLDGTDFRARINLALLRRGQLPGAEADHCPQK